MPVRGSRRGLLHRIHVHGRPSGRSHAAGRALTRGTHTRGMETYDTGRGTALESEFEHMADLVLVILCVAGGMLMWQTHGWLMAVSSIMFAAGGTLLVFHWGAVHMRRMGEDGR